MGNNSICNKTCINIVTSVSCVVAIALLVAAAANRDWFGTDQTRANGNPIVLSLNDANVQSSQVELTAKLTPVSSQFFASLRVVTSGGRQDSIFISYDGPLWEICNDEVVKSLASGQCQFVEYGGIAILCMLLVALVSLALLAAFAAMQLCLGKSMHTPCCSFIIGFFAFLGFFFTLLVGVLWGAIAVVGKDEINKQVPSIINTQISALGYSGSAPSDSGKFDADISLWVAVAAVPFALVAWIFNMIACCCVKRPKSVRHTEIHHRDEPKSMSSPKVNQGAPGVQMYEPKKF